MTIWADLALERRLAASPVWLRLVDTFTGRPPTGPLDVRLQRRVGTEWRPLDVPHQVSSSGDLGFLDLGRGRPGESGTVDVRVTVRSPRTLAAASTGDPFVQATVTIWTQESPPPTAVAQLVAFFPGPDYRFGPGTPLLSGRVFDAAGDPVDRARVSATEIVRGSPVVEEVLTADGWFRLPLRWSSGSTQIDVVRGALSGSKAITVPDDLPTTVTLTLT